MANPVEGDHRHLWFFTIFILSFVACRQSAHEDAAIVSFAEEAEDSTIIVEDTVGKKTVYLTFDDGPNTGSRVVMDIAQQENVPITFFTIGIQHTGENKHYFGNLWQRMHTQKAIEICNHSFTHAYRNHYEKFYASPVGVIEDFKKAADSGEYKNNIVRCPGNNIWLTPKITHYTYKRYKRAADSLHQSGYNIMGWDCEWRHYKQKLKQSTPQMYIEMDSMLRNNETLTPNHLVLLTHDMTFVDPVDSAQLHELVKMLKSNPLIRFDLVSHYPNILN
jgi:peptidoglycan-N-acetylglucosamine deacetylase